MNNKKKALLLSAMCSLAILSGCGNKSKEVEIDGEAYYQVEDTYVKKEGETKTFEPGEHIISYVVNGIVYYDTKGYIKDLKYPEIPEGYEVQDIIMMPVDSSGKSILFYFVNTKTVEATGEYNPKTNEYDYYTPGKVVKSLSLDN